MAEILDAREARLSDPHVRPLMDVVHSLRGRGFDVPNVDPNDGGVNARVLLLLETPGPRAVGSRFVSRDNPDPSAGNIGRALDDARLARSDILLWNVVPHCVSSMAQNRNVTGAEIRAAASATQAFIDLLPRLTVVVFCGRSARRAIPMLRFPLQVHVLSTFHPGAQAYNRSAYRNDIHETLKQAARLISSRDHCPAPSQTQ